MNSFVYIFLWNLKLQVLNLKILKAFFDFDSSLNQQLSNFIPLEKLIFNEFGVGSLLPMHSLISMHLLCSNQNSNIDSNQPNDQTLKKVDFRVKDWTKC